MLYIVVGSGTRALYSRGKWNSCFLKSWEVELVLYIAVGSGTHALYSRGKWHSCFI